MSSRRSFLRKAAFTCLLASTGSKAPAEENGGLGVLVDTTRCVGCRKCEAACNRINADLPRQAESAFNDISVFNRRRRMDAGSYTIVNRYPGPTPGKEVFAKFQCMHCLKPACVSACIVGALKREVDGTVVYDAQKCIGCRYCMVACPFQVPAYEYKNAFTPQVRKCTFCLEKRRKEGGAPACVEACPMEVMSFGPRGRLVKLAEERIRSNPGRYVNQIYGANEVGGTAWMYLASLPFQRIDLPVLGYAPVPVYTEPVQHAIFKWFLPPLGLYAILGALMWKSEDRRRKKEADKKEDGA